MTSRPQSAENSGLNWQRHLASSPVAVDAGVGVVAVATAEGEVVVLEIDTGRVLARTDLDDSLIGCALDPDGRRLAVSGSSGAWIWEFGFADPHRIVEGQWCSVATWAHRDRLAVAAGRQVLVVDSTGGRVWESPSLTSTVSDVVWLGGWRRLAASTYGGVHVLEPRPSALPKLLPFTGSLLTLAATPNGRWIVSGNQDASLQVFRTDKDTRLEMQGYPSKIAHASFDASGRWLANDGAPEVSIWDFSGKGPRGRAPALCVSSASQCPPGLTDWPECFAWQPTDAMLATGWRSGQVTVHRAADGVPERALKPAIVVIECDALVRDVSWTPDGSRFVAVAASGQVVCLPW
jgi:WD40 repeat protein